MPVQKQGQILSKGRHEKNRPRVSPQVMLEAVKFAVNSNDSAWNKQTADLFKSFIRVAPALAISRNKSVNLYGFGTFRVTRNKKGKRRLKFKVSSEISKYLDTFTEGNFETVLYDLLHIGKLKDYSLEEANYGR